MTHNKTHVLIVLLAAAALCGCTKSNMDSQPKYHEYEPGGLFKDGKVLQAPPAGTIARGDLARDAEAKEKPAVTAALLQRGQTEFNIYCSPCHDRAGTGHGIIVERGMPQPPSYHEQRLREADDQHFYDVISNGYGAMYSYADRIRPRDRWAIVAYLRALQLSQHATPDDLTPDQRARLAAEGKP
jgi:mono/diheme cytochrome c family protein